MFKPALTMVVAGAVAAGSVSIAARAQDAAVQAQPAAGARPAAGAAQGKGPVNDRLFAAAAAAGGLAEVASSRLAETKATGEEVKKFARQMVADHTRANQELMAAAAAKQVPLPMTLDAKDQAAADALNGLTGADFDREYIAYQVAAHMNAVQLFRAEAERGQDPDLKAWAAKTLPALQGHLKMAQGLAGRGGAGGQGGAGGDDPHDAPAKTGAAGAIRAVPDDAPATTREVPKDQDR